jgi:hypothetical protein
MSMTKGFGVRMALLALLLLTVPVFAAPINCIAKASVQSYEDLAGCGKSNWAA